MKLDHPPVWETEYALETDASPVVLWNLLSNVADWKRWNAGIEAIEVFGPFQTGTEFVMTPPGQPSLRTRLVEVRPGRGFVDETRVGDVRVFVDHRVEPIADGRIRVVFSIEAFGPDCDEIGAQASADFPDVLKSLVALAEAETGSSTLLQ